MSKKATIKLNDRNADHSGVLETDGLSVGERPRGPNRRKFLGQVGAAATAAGALATPSVSSAQSIGGGSNNTVSTAPLAGVSNRRVMEAMELRVAEAIQDAGVSAARNINNGDEARYADKGGTYTKGLPHDSFGRVDLNAYRTFKTALNSGEFSDFQNIIMGGTRTLNGPQAGLAFCLVALDNAQFGQPQVPPAPAAASDQNATELLEHYWASLLRDVAFTDYPSNSIVAQAAAELGSQLTYLGPRNRSGQVTPNLLFRGGFPGETLGPVPLPVLPSAHLLRLATHRPAASHLSPRHRLRDQLRRLADDPERQRSYRHAKQG